MPRHSHLTGIGCNLAIRFKLSPDGAKVQQSLTNPILEEALQSRCSAFISFNVDEIL